MATYFSDESTGTSETTSSGGTEDIDVPEPDAAHVLAQLRAGAFGDQRGAALIFFKNHWYPEALPEIASSLVDEDPWTRHLALSIITKYGAVEYTDAVIALLEKDPDESNQASGAHALGFLYRNTGDRSMLAVLARVVMDDTKSVHVREGAYDAMRDILRNKNTHALFAPRTVLPDIDWKMVEAYL